MCAGPLASRHRSDDPGGTVPSGACKDAPQPKTANAADPSQASAVEGHRHRERSARYFAQLRPQGRNGWQGEVRGPHPGACREYPRLGGTGGELALEAKRKAAARVFDSAEGITFLVVSSPRWDEPR